jgi:hypothetical protein
MAAEAAEFIRQNPNLAGNFRSLLSNGGPDVIHAFLHPAGGVAPPSANGLAPAPGVDQGLFQLRGGASDGHSPILPQLGLSRLKGRQSSLKIRQNR